MPLAAAEDPAATRLLPGGPEGSLEQPTAAAAHHATTNDSERNEDRDNMTGSVETTPNSSGKRRSIW